MSDRLPFEIREAMIKVCGKAFWYKDPLKSLLLQAGVPVPLYERYADESKFKIVRHILGELDQRGQSGWKVQHQILQELCRLRGVPDEAADKDEAIAALRWLKELASSQGMVQDEERVARTSRVDEAKRRQAAVTARAAKMEELRKTFLSMITSGSDDPHGRGYGLEDLLAELFDLHEIPYRRPYRTPAVCHVDNTGRIQRVSKRANPHFYSFLRRVKEITRHGLVLNTSLNMKGEPIVNEPSEAIALFLSTGLDSLILDHFVLDKDLFSYETAPRFNLQLMQLRALPTPERQRISLLVTREFLRNNQAGAGRSVARRPFRHVTDAGDLVGILTDADPEEVRRAFPQADVVIDLARMASLIESPACLILLAETALLTWMDWPSSAHYGIATTSLRSLPCEMRPSIPLMRWSGS